MQRFYYPETDAIGSMFYCINLKGDIFLTGNSAWNSIDYSSDGNILLTANTIYRINLRDTIEVNRTYLSLFLLNDSLILGFRKNKECGTANILSFHGTILDSIPFCGFSGTI